VQNDQEHAAAEQPRDHGQLEVRRVDALLQNLRAGHEAAAGAVHGRKEQGITRFVVHRLAEAAGVDGLPGDELLKLNSFFYFILFILSLFNVFSPVQSRF